MVWKKMVGDEVVCERWCGERWCVCDKVVCEGWCVKDGVRQSGM